MNFAKVVEIRPLLKMDWSNASFGGGIVEIAGISEVSPQPLMMKSLELV
jgi:hypothetical protein